MLLNSFSYPLKGLNDFEIKSNIIFEYDQFLKYLPIEFNEEKQ